MIPNFSIVQSWGDDGNVDVVFLEKLPDRAIHDINKIIEQLFAASKINRCTFGLDEALTKILNYWVLNNKLRYSPIVREWVYNE